MLQDNFQAIRDWFQKTFAEPLGWDPPDFPFSGNQDPRVVELENWGKAMEYWETFLSDLYIYKSDPNQNSFYKLFLSGNDCLIYLMGLGYFDEMPNGNEKQFGMAFLENFQGRFVFYSVPNGTDISDIEISSNVLSSGAIPGLTIYTILDIENLLILNANLRFGSELGKGYSFNLLKGKTTYSSVRDVPLLKNSF